MEKYTNKYYWIKVIFMFIVIHLRRFISIISVKPKFKNEVIDCPQKLAANKMAVDAVYFNGASKNGMYFVGGIARRQNSLTDTFLFLKVPDSGLGVLELPKLPSTSLYQTEHERGKYCVEGLTFVPVTPMKEWKLQYKGKMKSNSDPEKTFIVELDLVWKAKSPCFIFEENMDPLCVAKAMADQVWNREYFETLKIFHQVHYEQFGDSSGTIKVDGKTYPFKIQGMRDHSYGAIRDWRIFHRYGFHFITLENGDRMAISVVHVPLLFKRLPMGYVQQSGSKTTEALQWTDFNLEYHGENGKAPLDYGFSFTAGGKLYKVQIDVEHSPEFFISKNNECRILERMIKCTVNGIPGWGISEWEYRNVYGRNLNDIKL